MWTMVDQWYFHFFNLFKSLLNFLVLVVFCSMLRFLESVDRWMYKATVIMISFLLKNSSGGFCSLDSTVSGLTKGWKMWKLNWKKTWELIALNSLFVWMMFKKRILKDSDIWLEHEFSVHVKLTVWYGWLIISITSSNITCRVGMGIKSI